MNTQPRLSTIEMVKDAISRHSGDYSKYQLWKKLPKKMMYQTYGNVLEYLLANNEIVLKDNRKLERITINEELWLKAINRETILQNLSHYGYDLISLKRLRKHNILPIEELIIQILIRFPEARFIEAIPILIIKNKIDAFELYRKAYDYGLLNKIGFLLEMSFRIARKKGRKISYLSSLLRQLKSKKQATIQRFSTLNDESFLGKNTPREMRNWNLIGRFSINDFQEAYI